MSGSNQTIGGGGFHHIAIHVPDFDASVKFYIEGLGFTKKIGWGDGEKRAIMLDTGDGNYFELFARADATDRPEGQIAHVALRSGDVDAAFKQAVDAGAAVHMEPKDVTIPSEPHETPVRIAFVKAPEGTIIEFFQNELT